MDVGGWASSLIDELLEVGYHDATVVDVADRALQLARRRLEACAALVTWVVTDVLAWSPGRQFDVWHDRAVFRFLVDPEEQSRHVRVVAAAVRTGGHLVLGTFASDGPPQCSGLPVARYEAASLAELFAPAFTLVSAERQVHRTPAQVKQPFTWVVLRRVG